MVLAGLAVVAEVWNTTLDPSPEGLRPTAFKNPSACAENHSNPIYPKMIQMTI
jgi:hypothetical protein